MMSASTFFWLIHVFNPNKLKVHGCATLGNNISLTNSYKNQALC